MISEQKKSIVDCLADSSSMYISGNKDITCLEFPSITINDIALYQIQEVSFEEKFPRKEALENVISATRIKGILFIYLILGDATGVKFYYGIAKDSTVNNDLQSNINDLGEHILQSCLKGNFRGSKIYQLSSNDKQNIIDKIEKSKYSKVVEGVAGTIENSDKFQGVDRLADTMLGDDFGFMIIAKPLVFTDVAKIENNLYNLYNSLLPLSKKNQQNSQGINNNSSKGTNTGVNESTNITYSEAIQNSTCVTQSKAIGTSSGHQTSTGGGNNISNSNSSGDSYSNSSESKGTSNSYSESDNTGQSETKTDGTNVTNGKTQTNGNSSSKGTSSSVNESNSTGTSTSSSVTIEFIDKCANDWLKYLDEVILPRLDYGKGKGIFATSMFLFSNDKLKLIKLKNTVLSLFSGQSGNKIPLKSFSVSNCHVLKNLKNFKIPFIKYSNSLTNNEEMVHSAFSQYNLTGTKYYSIGNWMTSNELSLIAGLPQKEIVGLGLKEEVEFGLNINNSIKDENKIVLGNLVQSGNKINSISVSLDANDLDKHIFISGVTGSGKTTTCQKILVDSNLPFLIIEPAKKEYRSLITQFPDLLVFTFGKDVGSPFRLNPFEFFPHESITSRVDMIKASIESAFDMEAAIAQLIESAIYECYKDYGWDIRSNENFKFKNPFSNDVNAFPTLSDLIAKVDTVVDKQGFDNRLRQDYIGSIRARLIGLTQGSKGLMLDTPKSIDFREILNKKVVFELEEIRSGNEKALIMAFIFMNLTEAIKFEFDKGTKSKHITLIEESHRLLSKFTPGDSLSKKQAVETFTDILAEIRKYNECLIVVDQIPNKLTPEVLKNTNTKIIHKLFAQDDKEAIGNTIVLNNEQKEFLSNLETGSAIVFSNGYTHAVQVKIDNPNINTLENQVSDDKIKYNVYEFYSENYERSVIIDKFFFKSRPSVEELQNIVEASRMYIVRNLISTFISQKFSSDNSNTIIALKRLTSKIGTYKTAQLISYYFHKNIMEDNVSSINKRFKYPYPTDELILDVENFIKNYDKLSFSTVKEYKDKFKQYQTDIYNLK